MTTAIETLRVGLDERSYDILVGEELLPRAGEFVRPLLRHDRVIVITDETVAGHYLEPVEASLAAAGLRPDRIVLPPGEETKSFSRFEALVEELLGRGVARDTMLMALGGGVIGDLVGFAASVLLRGLDYIQMPTTLLAQVDSSVGGKTAINSRHGKNLVGAFHQPRLVLADIGALDSLPRRQLLAGYAEVAKYGLLGDAPFFGWLEGHAADLIEGDRALRRQAVLVSCRAKAEIVAEDERETGRRALLNLGHTFAHALEAETGFGERLLHGEAVAMGMALAFDLSAQLGLCPAADAARVHRHLASVGLATTLDAVPGIAWDTGRLIGHMRKDKKVTGGRLTFVLARAIGAAFVSREVREEDLALLLTGAIAA